MSGENEKGKKVPFVCFGFLLPCPLILKKMCTKLIDEYMKAFTHQAEKRPIILHFKQSLNAMGRI